MTAQILDRVLKAYRIGDPDGRFAIDNSTGSRLYPGRWKRPAAAGGGIKGSMAVGYSRKKSLGRTGLWPAGLYSRRWRSPSRHASRR